jgi:hypothetical protein
MAWTGTTFTSRERKRRVGRSTLLGKRLHDSYSSPNNIRMYVPDGMVMAGVCSMHGREQKYVRSSSQFFILSSYSLTDPSTVVLSVLCLLLGICLNILYVRLARKCSVMISVLQAGTLNQGLHSTKRYYYPLHHHVLGTCQLHYKWPGLVQKSLLNILMNGNEKPLMNCFAAHCGLFGLISFV